MIPKKIHYCWFGNNPLNNLAVKCIESWKKYLPDFEIIEWNEKNFDINCCQYVREAYEEKKWAFVSDYVRYKVLYEYGGIYFDTDVEVIRPLDKILLDGPYMGCENPTPEKMAVNLGVGCAAVPGMSFYREIIDDYESSQFVNDDGSQNLYTIVQRTTDILYTHGLQNSMDIQFVAGIKIYPSEYFCPINMDTGKLEITENTYTIHRFSASWVSGFDKFRGKVYFLIRKVFGKRVATWARRIFGRKRADK